MPPDCGPSALVQNALADCGALVQIFGGADASGGYNIPPILDSGLVSAGQGAARVRS